MNIRVLVQTILLCMICSMNVHAVTKTLPVFHAILFADTEDQYIGKTTDLDLSRISSMLIEAQSSLSEDMDFKYYIYPGKYCNPDNLRQVLDGIKVASQDVVFFYYSGHGVRSIHDKSEYPQMCMGLNLDQQSKMISLEGLDKEIAKKNPRLRFTFSDCCNSIGEDVTPKLEINKGPTTITSKTKINYKKLFLDNHGHVIMTSSRKGETSACNIKVGGYFTFCLLYVLEQAILQNVTDWDVIMESVYNSTVNISSEKMHPTYGIKITASSDITPVITDSSSSNNINSQSENESIVTREDRLLPAIRQLIDTRKTPENRISMVNGLLKEHFADNNVIVESLGRDSKTIVKTETSRDFAERLSTEFFLINFNVLKVSRNSAGKINHLKIHEIYKE